MRCRAIEQLMQRALIRVTRRRHCCACNVTHNHIFYADRANKPSYIIINIYIVIKQLNFSCKDVEKLISHPGATPYVQ
jgi:hypothetical protein